MIAYLKAGLVALEAAGVVSKILLALGAGAALLAAYGIWHHQVYQSGVRDTIAAIAREDQRSIELALKAREKWKYCRDQDLTWNQATGRCSR